MSQSSIELEELQTRLEKLEGESRGLRIFCVLLLVIGVIALSQNFKVRYGLFDTSGSLNVKDSENLPRAVIHATQDSSGLTLYDTENLDRAMFGTSGHGSGLTLRDVAANQRFILRVSQIGPEMLLVDEIGRVRISMRVDEKGPRMLFWGEGGEVVFDSLTAAGTMTTAAAAQPRLDAD